MTTSEVTTRSDPGYELSRFNAVGHGLLSRNTLLPWEDRGEYDGVAGAAGVAEVLGDGHGARQSFHQVLASRGQGLQALRRDQPP